MPKRIPIVAAKDMARMYGCKQVILVAWDGERMHVVTYGVSHEDCDQAAMGGNLIKKAIGFPDNYCNDVPHRVKKLKKENSELYGKIKLLEIEVARLRSPVQKCVACGGTLTPDELLADKCMACGELMPTTRGSDPGDDPDYVGA